MTFLLKLTQENSCEIKNNIYLCGNFWKNSVIFKNQNETNK
jgi:hypothetical protein